VPVEILCISCAASAVGLVIFFLPRMAAFVDNRASSVIKREGSAAAPATLAALANQGNS